mmetsp:Transcript_47953/g.63470  ORF Transcript_47953/g.63470 Transcript_47953/m.63470 type:complete len:145 (+) Transcript_47953:21-455(+)
MSLYKHSMASEANRNTNNPSPSGHYDSTHIIPAPNNMKKKEKPVKQLNDQELHSGWLENVRNEKRSNIKSLERSLKENGTRNRARVQQLLEMELDSVASKEYDPSNVPLKGDRFRRSYQASPGSTIRSNGLQAFKTAAATSSKP